MAIPQLSPSTNDENFQLSTVYWEVEYELDVVVNYQSYYTFGNLFLAPDNAVFYNNTGKSYTAGSTYCGIDDEWKCDRIKSTVHDTGEQHELNNSETAGRSFDVYQSPKTGVLRRSARRSQSGLGISVERRSETIPYSV